MAQAYSDDLRCKLLESYEVGEGSLRELAQQFRVSFGYSKKIRRQQLLTGQKERPAQLRHGPVSRIDSAAQEKLRGWLRLQPDLTEVELRDRLGEAGVCVCKSRIGQVLRAMGLRRKKNPSTPPSATRKPTASGAKNSSLPSPQSRRKG
ncbi:MAG: hypothetical protein ABSD13_10930 [Candidatus Korobacteraceae bacterium]|jgi:transposase